MLFKICRIQQTADLSMVSVVKLMAEREGKLRTLFEKRSRRFETQSLNWLLQSGTSFIEWEKLEKLSGVGISERSTLPDASIFTSLRSLQVEFSVYMDSGALKGSFDNVLSALPPLESLSLTGVARFFV